jgi:hypothetical protein
VEGFQDAVELVVKALQALNIDDAQLEEAKNEWTSFISRHRTGSY